MLTRLWQNKWSILALGALWLAFECWISWAAFCRYTNNPAGEEYGCIFRGPVASLIRFFYEWSMHTFDKPDAYVALFTAVLALFTLALWRSTDKLWEAGERQLRHSEQTAQRQLRAYIGHQPCGCVCHSDGTHMWIKYSEKNHGQTPAFNVELNVRLTVTAPNDYPGPFCRLDVMRMIHPQQEIGTAIFVRPATDDHPFRRDRAFFLYGFVDYEDCFERDGGAVLRFITTPLSPA